MKFLLNTMLLMEGYYKDTELTNEIIKDGWLYTGDEGEIDSDGFLKITGRVKDIFKTSKGKVCCTFSNRNDYFHQIKILNRFVLLVLVFRIQLH